MFSAIQDNGIENAALKRWVLSPYHLEESLNVPVKPMMKNRRSLVDEKSALNALCGDRQLLGQLATMFIEDAPNLLNELKSAMDDKKLSDARRSVHSLRGLVSTFYASEIVSLASQIEHDLSNGNVDSVQDGDLESLACLTSDLIRELRDSGYCV